MTQASKATAEARVVRKYTKLYAALTETLAALQHLESAGTFVDQAEFTRATDGHLQISYAARPMQLVIVDGGRRFILRVEDVVKDS